jgi:hypothetical protein
MGEILTSASDEAIQTTEPVWCIVCDNALEAKCEL